MHGTLINPQTPRWKAIVWCLKITVALQCLGNACAALQAGSPIFSLLWGHPEAGGLGWPESAALSAIRISSYALLVASVWILLRPGWMVLAPVALWELLLALAASWVGGRFMFEWTVLAHAARIAAPVGLGLIITRAADTPPSLRRVDLAMEILRAAIVVTFIVHGGEALDLHPKFVDQILVAADRLLGWDMPQTTAEHILQIIGVVDIAVALMLQIRCWKPVAIYMAFWGIATAAGRMVHGGLASTSYTYFEALIRAAHAGVPLAIFLYWGGRRHADVSCEASPSE